ncbi:MAG: type VI secretion system baseplate subunit TssF [Desulfohalobiaceae bacterium]|nr:type VI secretion system baseplate subunit TssF [Desulfohalobiaceae bacterium]
MLNKYYQQELSQIRELAREFSRAHPALAPMLSGTSQDPDVERLLEGVAFMTGMLRTKLDDEFPEVVHGLMQFTFPHYLRSVPACTLISFAPKPSLMEPLQISVCTELDSIPVQGIPIRFTTCSDLTVYPVKIEKAFYEAKENQPPRIRLQLDLQNITLQEFEPERLRFFLGGPYAESSNICYLLLSRLSRLQFVPLQGGRSVSLSRDRVLFSGCHEELAAIPYPGRSLPDYRFLQEYSLFPEKFLFLDILGWDEWKQKGNGTGFEIVFELESEPEFLPKVNQETFQLFVVPAVNVFEHEATPISLDHQKTEYRIQPAGRDSEYFEVYEVLKVTGFSRGTVKKREYLPLEGFESQKEDQGVYSLKRRNSPISRLPETYISLGLFEEMAEIQNETLSLQIRCTNRDLPASLQVGDVCRQTDNSPELCSFKNIQPPTAPVEPQLDKGTLWIFLSHLTLNVLSVLNKDNLKELLNLYVFQESRDQQQVQASLKKIQGIQSVEVKTAERLFKGSIVRGQEILLGLHQRNFASKGDMYIFGSILDNFFAHYSNINCFTRLVIKDEQSGEIIKWKTRVGDQFLE